MKLPTHPLSLMGQVYRHVFPVVHDELAYWKKRAADIPNEELRTQAIASIKHKTFHCEGGSILALAAYENRKKAIQFIVAYQTISDYLDNLCDRSTSLDPVDFAALHESMKDALTVGAVPGNYYRYREDHEDGSYLQGLVKTCQSVIEEIPNYEVIQPFLFELCAVYCNLQIHKHVQKEKRVERLQNWFDSHRKNVPDMEWYEFSACAGSTLGIFTLISYAFRNDFKEAYAQIIVQGYFPYIQGLHILLDYFIDQEEDRLGGDLNFCFYYKNDEELFSRLSHFLIEADQQTKLLPDSKFHQLINRGLLGVYLSDSKVNEQKNVKVLAKQLIRQGGSISRFFYWNGRSYRIIRQFGNGAKNRKV